MEEMKETKQNNIYIMVPSGDGKVRSYQIGAGKFKVLAGSLALLVTLSLGTAGYLGYQHYAGRIDRQAYQEYQAHKAEQEAKLQGLLDDNEKMLRDMSEIHTLETKLRRAVIRNSENQEFTSNIDQAAGLEGAKSTDPRYSGKGGPGKNADISMLEIVEAQNKNLTAQIDDQKRKMNELLSVMEGRNSRHSILPDLWPTDGGVVSSHYGGRMDPIAGGGEWHSGLDIAVDYGTPVYASAMGTVETAGWNGGYGQYVRINHSGGYETAYGHRSGIVVEPGQSVRKGEIIGFVGSTGYSTGPHVHFEIMVDGQTIDPEYMLKR